MKRKIAAAIIILIVVFVGLGGTKTLQIQTMLAAGKAAAQPPETVSSAVAREEQWQNTLPAIGSISAVQGVNITPEVPGSVSEIGFDSGAMVSKGDLLVRLDTSAEEAQLRAAEAQANLARLNADRIRQLRVDKTVSQSDLDTAEATLHQNVANADAIKAVIEKKTIRAPFAGKLGIRLVNLGQYLEAGKPVVSLQSLSPLYADFSLPQQDLAMLKTGMRVRVVTDTYPDKSFEGNLTAINPDLDVATRSVRLQATFENPEQLLRPGMFARVEVLLPDERKVLAIPATSVLSAPFGDSVFVIEKGTNGPNDGLIVKQRFVRTGRGRGDFVSVEAGLKPGERVVSAGLFKLRNEMAVVENNALAPKTTETPQPQNK